MNMNGLGGAAACAAGASCACAEPPHSAATTTPTAIQRTLPDRPTTVGLTSDRNITASLNKKDWYSSPNYTQELYENRHDLMSKKHSLTGQPHPGAVASQQNCLPHRLDAGANKSAHTPRV